MISRNASTWDPAGPPEDLSAERDSITAAARVEAMALTGGIAAVLHSWATAQPDSPFCHVGEVGYTFAEIDERANRVAAGFSEHAVVKGDRVAILTPNRPEVLELHFGLARVGAIQVPLNAFLKGTFLSYQLKQSRASVLVTDDSGLAAAQEALNDLPDLQLLVLLDSDVPATVRSDGRVLIGYRALTAGSGIAPEVEIHLADTMSIIYTSGTTGLPKGCILSHGYYVRTARNHVRGLELDGTDALYAAMPLFHAGGSAVILTSALVLGIPVHFEAQFSASNFMARLVATNASVVFAVGPMGLALLNTPAGPADRAHRAHTVMIAPMTPADQDRFRERFGIEPWTSVFGQSECMPIGVTPRSADRDRAACGTPAPDLEVALLGLDGLRVADGETGEICIRPREPYVMFDGYWDQPEVTLAAFSQLWYHTGDSGRLLPNGELVFVDRKKDALRRRGENISSLELEAAIRRHPKLAEVAVHAVPSPMGEDDIKVCVVLEAGAEISPEEMFEFFAGNLAYYMVPRYLEVLDMLPVNAVNRVMKHVLRERELTDSVWDFEALGFVLGRAERRTVASSRSGLARA